MTRFKGFLAILFLSISPLVMALDLDAAKAQGLLGEQPDVLHGRAELPVRTGGAGRKALARCLSDIAAMAGTPSSAASCCATRRLKFRNMRRLSVCSATPLSCLATKARAARAALSRAS